MNVVKLLKRRRAQMKADIEAITTTVGKLHAQNLNSSGVANQIGAIDLWTQSAQLKVALDLLQGNLLMVHLILSVNIPDEEDEWGKLNPDLPITDDTPDPPDFGTSSSAS